jgi:regulator of replication initiation timing
LLIESFPVFESGKDKPLRKHEPLGRYITPPIFDKNSSGRTLPDGKALYNKAMQNVRVIIEQNKQLLKENGRLTEENGVLRKRIASMDENAITRLRDKKNAEIKDLQERLGKAESEAVRSSNIASRERQRADKAEGQIKEMLGIPEIKKI